MSSENHIVVDDTENCLLFVIKESRVYDEILVNKIYDNILVFLEPNKKPNVLVDFSNVSYLSSSFIGKIIGINKKVKASNHKLILCGISEDIMEIFQITRLEKFFHFEKTKEDALSKI